MPISEKDIEKIANLAKLAIPSNKLASYNRDLSAILTLADNLNRAKTKTSKPMAHPLEATQPLRKDQATETNQRDTMLSLAPQKEAGLYLVPKVIE